MDRFCSASQALNCRDADISSLISGLLSSVVAESRAGVRLAGVLAGAFAVDARRLGVFFAAPAGFAAVAVFFAGVFLAGAFLAGAFLAVGFLAAGFLEDALPAAGFLAEALSAAGFLVVVFFAAAFVDFRSATSALRQPYFRSWSGMMPDRG